MSWFTALAPREKWLIILAASLTILFVLWQFLIAPVLGSADTAQRQLNAAQRDHMIVSTGLPKMALQNGTANKAVFNNGSVIEAARLANIGISRVQPGPDDRVQVWLEDAPTQSVYTFLSELNQRYQVRTDKAQMTRRDGGTVASQFTFSPG